LRKRSSAIINQDLLIDPEPDIMTASQMHNLSLEIIQYCLQIHAHPDHLDFSHFLSRSPGYGIGGAPLLHFYASPGSLQRIYQTLNIDLSSDDLRDPGPHLLPSRIGRGSSQ
jgi:phosphoribosyl 1,2-cyclic phosphate phosphodiesterase